MTIIATTAKLDAFCGRIAGNAYVTVDTEFLRDKTYWPLLCLVQLAGPDEAFAIDPLAPDMDLAPLYRLMSDPKILKVFHAARQDVEIFFQMSGQIPTPLFDTQVAAMACGFGESVGYETLAAKLAGAHIDKSSRFTDWSHRPLTDRQLQYALSDVTHLRRVYDKLERKLQKSGRTEWLREELAVLTDPATYRLAPEEAWHRLKPRSSDPRFLAVLRELASWREVEAQRRNVPRNRILRDEALLEVAAHPPRTSADLARLRSFGKGLAESRIGQDLLGVVERARALPVDSQAPMAQRPELPSGRAPVVELLRVLLKLKCESHGVAQKLVASSGDLDLIAAADDADVPALSGWRRELFGEDALALKHGRLALTMNGGGSEVALVNVAKV
ncbi:MAG: ribonuclease D [Alphaproteobacteria bacterium]|nr:ribonuclease D [Alphaproteobacteria bacterium]